MIKKYVLFKDDDAGKNLERLKAWINVVLDNNAKGCIGVIGKHLKNNELLDYMNSLNPDQIENCCQGYRHSCLSFLHHGIKPEYGKKPVEQDKYMKAYRKEENKSLRRNAVVFDAPAGNHWNHDAELILMDNDFRAVFSETECEVGSNIVNIIINNSFKYDTLEAFINDYMMHRDDRLYALRFNHASLYRTQFSLMAMIIDFLKDYEHRSFVTPSEYLNIIKKDAD